MEKKMILTVRVSMCLIFVLAALLLTPAWSLAKEPIKLKLGEAYPARHPMTTRAYGGWAKMVEKGTNGRVKVTVFPGGTLAKVRESYDATIAGVCDIGMFPQSYAGDRFPLSLGMNLPMLFPNSVVASRVAWELYKKFPEIRTEYSDVKLLFFYCTSPYEIHTVKKPIHTARDLKGLQIRAAGPIAAAITQALGATPVAISMPEAYLGLQKGVLDGLISPFGPMKHFKTADVTRYHTVNANLFSNVFCVVMNLAKWNRLPSDIQRAIGEVSGPKAAELFGTVFDGTGKPDLKYMKEQGDTFITLSPEEKARWVAAIKPIRGKWINKMAAKGMPGEKVLEEMIRLSERYSQ